MSKKKKNKSTAKPAATSSKNPQHRSVHASSSAQHASSASPRLPRDRRDPAGPSDELASSASLRLTGHSRDSADRRSADKRSADRRASASAASASASADRRSADRPAAEHQSAGRQSEDRRSVGPHAGGGADELASSMQTFALTRRSASASSAVQPAMRRPGFGKAGRPIDLIANFFQMQIPKNLRVFVHAVMIKRQIHFVERHGQIERARGTAPGARRGWVDVSKDEAISYNRNVFDAFLLAEGRRLQSALAYDGRSIAYSAKKLDLQLLNTDFDIVVDDEGRAVRSNAGSTISRETVKVHVQSSSATLNFADYLDPNQRGLQREPFQAALDVAMANGPARTHVMVGRSFYSPSDAEPLGQRNVTAMAWRGFYQSVRPTLNGLMVNMDQSFTAFWKGGGEPLMRLVMEANGGRPLSVQDGRGLRDMSKKLKLLKLRARHTGITFKLHGFADRGADDQRFECEGRSVSVREYFHEKYRINLQYPQLPLVRVKRDTYVPLEMLDVVEKQRMRGLLQPDQLRSIVRVASTRPQERMRAASSKMNEIMQKADAVRDSFNIGVSQNLVRLKGRVLPTPDIMYGGSQSSKPQGGQWFAPKKGGFSFPFALKYWVVLNNSREYNDRIMEFLKDFFHAGQRAGVAISKPHVMVDVGREGVGSRMHSVFDKYMSKDGRCMLQLMMVIQERQDAAEYNEIKRIGDLKYGVPTQVLLSKNATNPRRRDMFCDNVLLKVNSKLGGQNSFVRPFDEVRSSGMKDPGFLRYPHIVLGADVTHPMPGGNTCSVAALVGSRDRQGVQFSASIRNQGARVEIIQDLGNMFKEVYEEWHKNFKRAVHAQSIIMFRDGVADGQYEQVLSRELRSLRQACVELGMVGQRPPRITYIIVTKRHHARFFAQDQRMQDRSGNIPAGTVVDHTVTSPDYYEFYVNSHAGIQGTSKPSKYVVLLDENNMGVDELQGYVFRLSHGYARCNRSVSMVNSAYYAHLLAFRGRAYLQEGSDTNSNQTNASEVEPTAVIHQSLRPRLYFV